MNPKRSTRSQLDIKLLGATEIHLPFFIALWKLNEDKRRSVFISFTQQVQLKNIRAEMYVRYIETIHLKEIPDVTLDKVRRSKGYEPSWGNLIAIQSSKFQDMRESVLFDSISIGDDLTNIALKRSLQTIRDNSGSHSDDVNTLFRVMKSLAMIELNGYNGFVKILSESIL